MSDPFRSARLIYRAVEDTPGDDTFLHSIQSDAWAYANSSTTLLKPESEKATIEGLKKYLTEKALLGVIICLADSPIPASEGGEIEANKPGPIGFISLRPAQPGNGHHRESYISIYIAAAYRNKGYGSEAIEWTLNWSFQIAGLHRIGIESFSYNEGATRLYKKLGFVLEGRKRESLWFNGGWHDWISYSLLEHEWRERERQKGRKF